MSANFKPTLDGYSGISPFRFWCQKVLPLVYDDSLSYYELLNKVVDYLNNTIKDVATMEDNVDKLNTAYGQLEDWTNAKIEELETFINNYFDNLDVQEEINNKLDDMATDGSLTQLLSPFIPTLVTSWLNENVDPVGSAVMVDSSLSISGAAADAKVTGDKFKLSALIMGLVDETFTDTNDAETGIYVINSSDIPNIQNLPDTTDGLILFTYTTSIDSSIQFAYKFSNSIVPYEFWERTRSANTWSEWRDGRSDKTLSIAGRNADAKVTGDKLNSQEELIKDISTPIEYFFDDELEDGYYSTVDGTPQTSASYLRSKEWFRIEEFTAYICDNIDGATNVRLAMYDKDFNYINYITLGVNSNSNRNRKYLTLESSYWGRLYTNNVNLTNLSCRKLHYEEIQSIEYPYINENIYHLENTFVNASTGVLSSSSSTDVIIIPNPKAGDKWFISNMASAQAVCVSSPSLTVLEREIENVDVITGQIVTIPENTAYVYFNLYRNNTTGITGDDHMCDYVCKITKGKVLAIGDSITWLDGRNNYGNMTHFSGWQRQLRLNGYDCRRAGFSGYPYAMGLDVVGGVDYSIYTEIVTNQYDVSDYDYIILFGGANDVLYGGANGNRIVAYDEVNFDPYTFNGALGGILRYLRLNNSDAKIIIATFPKSEAASRVFNNANSKVEELKYNALFWSCELCDIFQNMNIQPTFEQFSENFYDQTHPNFEGMQKIGKLMVKALDLYE